MTPITRGIVLFSICSLGIACSDAPEPERASADVGQAPRVDTTTLTKQPIEALLAVAPPPPRSVADPAKSEPTSAPAVQSEETPRASEQEASSDLDRPIRADEVKVQRFLLAADVQGREPIGEAQSFPEGTPKIFAFVQLANEGEPFAFTVHFEPVEGPSSPYGVRLEVPTAKRFRTWSWTAIRREPGRYRAVLRTLAGEEIARRELEITPVAQ